MWRFAKLSDRENEVLKHVSQARRLRGERHVAPHVHSIVQ
jgi:hypothetical protein